MTGSGRLGRLLVGSLQHARAGWQGQAAVGGQHLLGLVNDASNLPSTSGSRSGLLGAGVIGAGAAGTAWQGSTIGQRHLSFWRRAPATPAATDGAAMASTDSQTPSEGAEAAVAESAGFFPLPEDSSEVFSAIESACAAIESATIAAAKADTWFAPAWFIGAITTAHETFGTPWWASIMLFNVCIRAITMPLMILAQKASAKMVLMNHDLIHAKKLQEASMKAKTPEEQAKLFKAFQDEYTSVVKKHGGLGKTFGTFPLVMITNGFIFISVFSAINKMMAAKVPSLTTGGALTFVDLTVPDPYFLLPVTCTVVTLLNIEYGMSLNADMGLPEDRAMMTKRMKNMFRIFAVAFIPFGYMVPSGVANLWVSNTAFGTVQGLLLRNASFRKTVGLPTMEEMKSMNVQVQEANKADPTAAKATATPSLDSASAPTALFSHKPKTAAK